MQLILIIRIGLWNFNSDKLEASNRFAKRQFSNCIVSGYLRWTAGVNFLGTRRLDP